MQKDINKKPSKIAQNSNIPPISVGLCAVITDSYLKPQMPFEIRHWSLPGFLQNLPLRTTFSVWVISKNEEIEF